MTNNESSQVVTAVKKVLPAVVSIVMTRNMPPLGPRVDSLSPRKEIVGKRKKIKIGGGSGFIVNPEGIIVTNRHVIEDRKTNLLVILQDGRHFQPEILACDMINDIAILKITLPAAKTIPPQKTGLPVVKLGDSSKLELGQTAIAIGNALGMFRNTVSTGVVSGMSREIQAESEITRQQTHLRGLIQTDAAINPGNSGGPLVDITGKAIGINAAMVSGAENIGFALPINNAIRDLQELKKYGRIRHPFLGVRYLAVTEELKNDFNLPVNQGALIIAEPDFSRGIRQAVIPGSPAAKAGLKEADIIFEIEKQKVTPEKSVADILQECEIGKKITFKILRKGKEKLVNIILAERKN